MRGNPAAARAAAGFFPARRRGQRLAPHGAWLGYQRLKAQGAHYIEVENGDHGLDHVADLAAETAFAWLQGIDFRTPPPSTV
ncbi:MAG: hypothetical protein JSS11_08220 [Verrucomicrobia bacterium]|nr:hypothetical protein [Verrucomicrobiota bacterium]